MVTSKRQDADDSMRRRKPARSPEAIENHLIALAYDEVEKRILAGHVTSQELIHFLKRGTEREKQEVLKLQQETLLAQAKVDAIASGQRIEALYAEAMNAFRGYQPTQDDEIL